MNPGPSERANSILVPSGEIAGKPSKLSLKVQPHWLAAFEIAEKDLPVRRIVGERTHEHIVAPIRRRIRAPSSSQSSWVRLDALAGLGVDGEDRHRGRALGAIDRAAPGAGGDGLRIR
jgi:hypothetical protein